MAEYMLTLKNEFEHEVSLGRDTCGNIQRIDNLLNSFPDRQAEVEKRFANTRVQLENAKEEVEKPFPQEQELKDKEARLEELNVLLSMDENQSGESQIPVGNYEELEPAM